MRVIIATDMEGVAGVVGIEHLRPAGQDYYRAACRWLTAEINGAIQGARRAGASEFAVQDGHGQSLNILPDVLDEDALLISGSPGGGMLSMIQGMDGSFDVAGFVGVHARQNSTTAVLDHTAYRSLRAVYINDVLMGEYGLVGGFLGYFGVPIVFAAGDQAFEEQIKELVPNIAFARTKTALSRTSAISFHPRRAAAMISEAAEDGITRRGEIEPIVFASPVTIKMEFHQPIMSELAEWVPGVRRVDAQTLSFTHDDYKVVYGAFVAMGALAGSVRWMLPN